MIFVTKKENNKENKEKSPVCSLPHNGFGPLSPLTTLGRIVRNVLI